MPRDDSSSSILGALKDLKEHQAKQIDELRSLIKDTSATILQQLGAEIDKRVKACHDDLMQKFTQLQDRMLQYEKRAESRDPSSPKRARTDGPSGLPPSSQPSSAYGSARPELLHVTGFPRKVLRPHLEEVFAQAVSKLPSHLSKGLEARCGTLSNRLTMVFPGATLAKQALDCLSKVELYWKDPRDEATHRLRFSPDRSIKDRQLIRGLSACWAGVHQLLGPQLQGRQAWHDWPRRRDGLPR